VPKALKIDSSASSDSGDARGDGESVPIRPQIEDQAHARMRRASPTMKKKTSTMAVPAAP
jgi:hypothetical protein